MRYEITIEGWWPAGINHLAGRHWRTDQGAKRKAFEVLAAHVLELELTTGQPRPVFAAPVRLEVIREYGYRQRELDYDNLAAAGKHLVDALRRPNRTQQKRRLGIIVDDAPQHLVDGRAIYTQQRSPDRVLRTRIVIEGELDTTGDAR